MLRRPPTVLALTSEDVKAYEDHREAEAFQHATAAAQLRRQQQLARNMSGMDITGITTSSDDEDYSEQEASYYPNRTYSQNARISRQENIEGLPDEGIYRNEGDSDDYEDASEGGGQAGEEEAFIEDEDMAEAERMDLDADHNDDDDVDDDDNDIPGGAAVPNLHHTRRPQQEPIFPSPPPAPSRMTRSTRSASTEPSSSQAGQQQQQHHHHHQQPAPAGRFPRGAGTAAQTHRRAHSGRAAAGAGAAAAAGAEATTPTPVAQAQRDAADRVRARATRSRDERIGVTRGGRR